MPRIAMLALAALALVPAPAPAQPDGIEIKVEDKSDEYKYEYKSRHCEFKYEFKYDKGEEKVDEKGDCPPRSAMPRFAPPVGGPALAGTAPRSSVDFCDRALAGAVGSQAASGGDRAVAIVLGGLLGGVVGNEIGRRIDDADRRCLGRALEHAEPGVEVGWTGPESELRHDLRRFGPVAERHGVPCRSFEIRLEGDRWREAEACQRGDGSWQLVGLR